MYWSVEKHYLKAFPEMKLNPSQVWTLLLITCFIIKYYLIGQKAPFYSAKQLSKRLFDENKVLLQRILRVDGLYL